MITQKQIPIGGAMTSRRQGCFIDRHTFKMNLIIREAYLNCNTQGEQTALPTRGILPNPQSPRQPHCIAHTQQMLKSGNKTKFYLFIYLYHTLILKMFSSIHNPTFY